MDIMPIKKRESKATRERVLSLRASTRTCLSSLVYILEPEDCNTSKQSAVLHLSGKLEQTPDENQL